VRERIEGSDQTFPLVRGVILERTTGFEPATPTLARFEGPFPLPAYFSAIRERDQRFCHRALPVISGRCRFHDGTKTGRRRSANRLPHGTELSVADGWQLQLAVCRGSLDRPGGGSSRCGDTNVIPTAHRGWRAVSSHGLISGLWSVGT